MSAKSRWVRVRSEDELVPPMVIKFKNCAWCGDHPEVMTILRRLPAMPFEKYPDGHVEPSTAKFGFETIGSCDDGANWQFDQDIADGCLFRLAVPPDEAALADEKEAGRRAAKVKERTQ